MTAKTVTVRLYVALVSMLVAVLCLAAAVVRLGAALALRTARAIERPAARPQALQLVPGGKNARVSPPANVRPQTYRLTTALVGMGFRPAAVRAHVAGLPPEKITDARIEDLIKEGVAALAA